MTSPKIMWVLLLGGLAQILLLVSVAFPPVQDYPNHLLRVHASGRLDEVPVYSEYLEKDAAFRPNSLGDWVVGGLATVLPIRVAGKVWLVLTITVSLAATWYYLETFGGSVLATLIALHVAGGWLFHKGFLNNHVAISLGLIYLAILWPRDGRLSSRRWLVALAVSLAMVTAHAFAYGGVMLTAGAAALFQPDEAWRRRIWRLSPAIPGVLMGALYAVRQAGTGLLANRPSYESGVMESLLWQPLSVFGRFWLAWDRRVALFSLLLVFLAFLVCLHRRRTGTLSDSTWVVMLFVFAGVGLYLLAPTSLSGGWVHGRQRVAHLGVLLALPLLSVIPPVVRRMSTGVLAVALLVTVVFTAIEYRRFQPGAREYFGLADSLPEGQLILTLNLVSPLDELIRPGLHLWSYVCIERDCLSPFLFANPYANNLYFKRIPEWPPEGELEPRNWDSIRDVLNRESYDGVLLHGRSPEGESLLEGVLLPVARNDSGILFMK